MTQEAPAPYPAVDPAERVAKRTVRERRGRVLRSALLFGLVTAGMALVLVVNRDNQQIRSCAARMEYAVGELQRMYDEDTRVPLQLPVPPEVATSTDTRVQAPDRRSHVHYDAFFTARLGRAPQMGVCCCVRPHTRLMLPNGRHVITFDAAQGKYAVQWMDEAEFVRRQDELGLRVPRP